MPGNSDIVLTHADGTSNRVELTLAPGGWSVETVSPAAPRQVEDAANYQQQSPDVGLTYDVQSWHRGFGETTAVIGSDQSLNRYGYSDGVLAMFNGELSLGYQEDEVDLLVRNGRFETGATSPWTGTSATIEMSTNAAHSGTGAVKVTVGSNNGHISDTYQGSVTPLRSRTIKLIAYARRISGTGNAKAQIVDSVGSSIGVGVTSDDWSLIEVDHTIDSGATTLGWRIVYSVASDVWETDDIAVIPVGGVDFPSPAQEFKDNIYVVSGRGIYKWNEANDYFEAVFMDSAVSFTDIKAHSDSGTTAALYAARGSDDNYLRSTDGTTWADPTTNSGDARLAERFARVRNANGDYALMKTRVNFVSLATNPSDTVNWGAEIQVGDADRKVTNLISANDTAYVGREDGLLVYDGSINQFRDLEPEANFFPDAENFQAAIGRGGSVWATGGDQAFWQITPGSRWPFHDWADFSYLFSAPAYRGFGGRVTALAQDRHNIWVALADNLASTSNAFPYTFPFTFATVGLSDLIRIIAIRVQSQANGQTEIVAHTVTGLSMNKLQQMGRIITSEQASLFAFGSSLVSGVGGSDTDEPRVVRIRLPINNENPRSNSPRALRTAGDFYTPSLNFNYPDAEKVGLTITIGSLNFAAGTKFVTVSYKLDDASGDDASGWILWGDDGVFDVSPSETKTAILTGPLTHKTIRFKYAFTSDSSTDAPPVIRSFVFKAGWNPIDYQKYAVVVKLSDRRSLQLRRMRQRGLRTADLANLRTLRKQPFCVLTDPEGTQTRVKLRFKEETVSQRVDVLRGRTPERVSVLNLNMTEMVTT